MNLSSVRPLYRLASCLFLLLITISLNSSVCRAADGKKAAPPEPPATDVLVLSNGDTLHGNFVKEVGGKVTFHTASLGDLEVTWDHIKELHAPGKYGVLQSNVKLRGKKTSAQIPTGAIDVTDQAITVHGDNATATPIPVKNAPYVVDAATLDKQIHHEPGFFAGWNGAATAGATLVQATQNQYTISGGIGLVRTVPTVTWLDPRNRTVVDFTGSFGKITQPGTQSVKSAIYHADLERDQYFSPRFYALAQGAWDHDYAQLLGLQQIYGGGIGLTLVKTPRQEADAKATIQYEKQAFLNGSAPDQNLVGSTFAVNYLRNAKSFTFTQQLGYIPAYNTPSAYSAAETDTLAFTAYKNFGFSVGTIDTYLNDAPVGTKKNSFQFTMGLTYAIKSKY